MKKALTGARIFSGKNFADKKALLFENENIIQLVDETEIPKDFITQNLNVLHIPQDRSTKLVIKSVLTSSSKLPAV